MKKAYHILTLVLGFSTMMHGCPAVMRVELKNENDKPISVIYSPGYESKIAPEQTKEVLYQPSCLRIRLDNAVYEYHATRPPEAYINKNAFTLLTHAVFTKNHGVRIFGKNQPYDFKELDKGCNPHQTK